MSGMNAQPEIAVYYPNVIGTAFPGSSASCAILVEGKDNGSGEISVKIPERIVKHGGHILIQKGYVNERTGTYTLLVVCQLAGASLDDVVIELRKLRHVTNAQSLGLRGQMFDGMMFPLLLNDAERIVGLNPDVIFDMQEMISSPEDKRALLEAGRKYGSGIVASIKEGFATRPDGKKNTEMNIPVALLEENTVRYLMATGWGRLSWDHGTTFERALVHDPPCPKNMTAAGNRFIQGLFSGLAESLQGKRFSVIEDQYDASRRVLTIGMVEASVATKMERQEARAAEVDDNLVQSEVKRISDSLEQLAKPQESKQEVAVPVHEGKLQVTFTRKNPVKEKENKVPSGPENAPKIAPPLDVKRESEIIEEKKKLEERTRELESLLSQVEDKISNTKEALEKTESTSQALDNVALTAAKYVAQTKQKKKKVAEPAYMKVLQKRSPGQFEDDGLYLADEEERL